MTKADYQPFGEQLSMTGTPGIHTYNGNELDDEWGFDLYYYGARYMDPALGRFITPDPINDFLNPYSYVGNNPMNRIDPTGMLGLPRIRHYGIPAFMGSDTRLPMWKQIDSWRAGNRWDMTMSNTALKAYRHLLNAWENSVNKAVETKDQVDWMVADQLLSLLMNFDSMVWSNTQLGALAEMNRGGVLIVSSELFDGTRSDALIEAILVHEVTHAVFDKLYPNWDRTGSDIGALDWYKSDGAFNEIMAHTKEFEYYEKYSEWGQGFTGPLRGKDSFEVNSINEWRNWDSNNSLGWDFWRYYIFEYKNEWNRQLGRSIWP